MWDKQTVAHNHDHLTSWPVTGKKIIKTNHNMSDVVEHDKYLIEKS